MAKSASIQCEVKTEGICVYHPLWQDQETGRHAAAVESVGEGELLSTVNILRPVRAPHPARNVGHVDTWVATLSRGESPQCSGVTLLTPHSLEAEDNYYNDHINIRVSHHPRCSEIKSKVNLKVGTFKPILPPVAVLILLLEGFRTSIVIILLPHFQIDLEQIIRTNLSIFSISVSVRTAGVRAPVRWWIAGDGDDWGHLIGQSPCSG